MIVILTVIFAVIVGALIWTKLTIEEYQEQVSDLYELAESLAKSVRDESELLYKRQEALLLKVNNLSNQSIITAKTLDNLLGKTNGKHIGEDLTHEKQ